LRRRTLAVALIPIAAALAGCDSTTSGSPNAPAAQVTSQEPASNAQTSSASAAAPNTSGPASFVVNAGTHGGDEVKIEGWFGPPVPAGESTVEQTALSQCASPTDDGRAIVVALDLTATMESSLAGEVELTLGTFAPETLAEYILGASGGSQCGSGVEDAESIKLGTLQPHQSTTSLVWIAFGNAITPNDAHPSEATLRANNWIMELPRLTIDGESSAFGQVTATGARVVKCVAGPIESEETIAVIGGMPKVVHGPCP
jgi:hypothetical protein